MAHVPITQMESSYIEDGLLHVDRLVNANSEYRSPLIAVLAGFPAKAMGDDRHFARLSDFRFLIRLPFLMAGLLLGASLWYVARRLYGNLGGYIALGLYCFSPMAITRSSQVQPDIVGAWGAFGLVFTGIAAAHTLYAPREVVLLELEAHSADGHLHRALRRLAVVVVDGAASDAGLHVVGGTRSSRGGPGDLRGVLCRRPASAVGGIQLSSARVCGSAAQCQLDRVFPSQILRQDRLFAAGTVFPAERPGAGDPAAGVAGDICFLEAHPLFRDGRSADRRRPADRSWPRRCSTSRA